MTDHTGRPLMPLDVLRPPHMCLIGAPKVLVDTRAFLFALIASPLILGSLGAVLVLPGMVILFGLPATMLVGGPVAWWTISRFAGADGKVGFGQMVAAGILAAALTGLLVFAFLVFDRESTKQAIDTAFAIGSIGMVVAILQGLLFAWIYRAQVRPQPDLHRLYREWII